jgi:hypothetical protein
MRTPDSEKSLGERCCERLLLFDAVEKMTLERSWLGNVLEFKGAVGGTHIAVWNLTNVIVEYPKC